MSYRRILVPVDGSAPSNTAVASAIEIAQLKNGRLRFLYCLGGLGLPFGLAYSSVVEAAREEAEGILAQGVSTAKRAQLEADARMNSSPDKRLGHCVADEARDWEADLIVVGTHGRKGLARALLGSGAESIIREARVPVMVVR
jgi:nucleotide-binding universal stress UspA family protein